MTFKEIEKLLKLYGWYKIGSRGSHFYYVNDRIPGKITIPKHGRRY